MGRVFKIIMYLVLLLLVYLWFSTIFKSCGDGTTGNNNIETVDDELDDADDLAALDEEDENSDEFFEDEDDVDYEELDADVDTEDDDIYEEDIDYTTPDAKPTSTKPSTTKAPTQSSKPASKGHTGGKYMVVAGSYLIKSNAESMRDKLARLGYNSEVVIFDLSEYHSVSAGKYPTYEDARSATRQLSGKGIDSYVHTRK